MTFKSHYLTSLSSQHLISFLRPVGFLVSCFPLSSQTLGPPCPLSSDNTGKLYLQHLGLSTHSKLHAKILFPDLQGISSFSTLPLRGQTTYPYLFPPSTHCLLCLGFLHSTSQGLQTLCVCAQTSLCLEWRLEASRHGDGLCSLPYLCLQCLTHHRHWVNPCRMRSKVKENQKGRKPNRWASRLQKSESGGLTLVQFWHWTLEGSFPTPVRVAVSHRLRGI